MTSDDWTVQRLSMVRKIKTLVRALRRSGQDIELDQRVLDAMATIPRQAFVPESAAGDAYANSPIDIGFAQTISQPLIVAIMSSLAQLSPSARVLEVGTGSGYQAAVLAALAGHVYTVEKIRDLAHGARQALAQQRIVNVSMRIADGYQGWEEHAPFDAILVTAAPPDVPEALIQQLAPGGRLVIPVGEANQILTLIDKAADGTLRRTPILEVRFVPLVAD